MRLIPELYKYCDLQTSNFFNPFFDQSIKVISIIISSAKKELLDQVSKNIADTIAVTHQIIAFDNSDGKKGICQIYNEGIAQARYNTLCFMHEDVAIRTLNWGQKVTDFFSLHPDVGLIGIVGNSYKPLAPSGGIGNDNYYRNIIQCYKFTDHPPEHQYYNPKNESYLPVACVDGVWFCTTKQLALKHGFDERFTGFHAYDMDFSLAIGSEKKVAVVFDILLEHFSEGRYNESWLKDVITLYDKWYDTLPRAAEDFSKKHKLNIERKTFKHFIGQLAQSKLLLGAANHFLWKNNRFLKLSPVLFLKLQFYIVVAYIRRWLGIKPK